MNLETILNTLAVPLEADGLEFSLTPFPNTRVIAWNRATHTNVPSEATNEQVLDISEQVQKAQLDIISSHMRTCIAKGDTKRVTSEWVGKTFPQPVLQDLANYFATGTKPKWAGELGN